jgi:predicted aminopeptidase
VIVAGVLLAALVVLVTLTASGCLYTRYVAQAAYGQFDLLGRAKPLREVIHDPDTSLRVALLLAEIPAIKQYGRRYGLAIRKNYETYVQLGRPAAVWFTAAADPVAFKPLKWCFPIAGCFAGLGWFDEQEAVEFKQKMEAKGYDAFVRPASAYSTGGWFPDPVLSTMLGSGDDALPELFNVIIHESVHATVLVKDQPFFNESFASYVADTLTDAWIAERFGPGSPEHVAWTLGQALHLPRVARALAAYKALEAVYESDRTREQKLAEKARIIDELVADLKQRRRPNNASLTEVRVYSGGTAPLILAHRACGDLRALVEAAKTLAPSDFQRRLQEDLTGVGRLLGQRCASRAAKKILDRAGKSAHDPE